MSFGEVIWNTIAMAIFGVLIYVLVRPSSNAATGIVAVSDTLANIVKMAVGG